MFELIASHFNKILAILRSLEGWIIVVISVYAGFSAYHLLHQSEIRELQLKSERLTATSADEQLSDKQFKLLGEIAKLQARHKENKAIIGKDGEVYDDEQRKLLGVNVIKFVFETDTPRIYQTKFEDLVMSIPSRYMYVIPEARFDSPFVLRVTEQGLKKISR